MRPLRDSLIGSICLTFACTTRTLDAKPSAEPASRPASSQPASTAKQSAPTAKDPAVEVATGSPFPLAVGVMWDRKCMVIGAQAGPSIESHVVRKLDANGQTAFEVELSSGGKLYYFAGKDGIYLSYDAELSEPQCIVPVPASAGAKCPGRRVEKTGRVPGLDLDGVAVRVLDDSESEAVHWFVPGIGLVLEEDEGDRCIMTKTVQVTSHGQKQPQLLTWKP